MAARPERPILPPEVTTRVATVADARDIARMRQRMFESMGVAEETTPEAVAQSVAYLERAIPTGEFVARIACVDDTVIGSAAVFIMQGPPFSDAPDGRVGRILNVFVDEVWRGRGVARALLIDVLDECSRLGIRRVGLIATDIGAPVYEALGFEPARELRIKLDDWHAPSC